jgi:hypothetical protein
MEGFSRLMWFGKWLKYCRSVRNTGRQVPRVANVEIKMAIHGLLCADEAQLEEQKRRMEKERRRLKWQV